MTGKGPKQFFTTLPGILTATATLIVAITGLYMALQSGCDKENRQEELGGPASQVSAENQQEELGPTNIQVSAQGGWQSTGVSLTEGQSVTVTADGNVRYSTVDSAPHGGRCGPDGVSQRPWMEDISVVTNWNHAALIARLVPVGTQQRKHLIGRWAVVEAKRDGSLQFRLNDTAIKDNSGHFTVVIAPQ